MSGVALPLLAGASPSPSQRVQVLCSFLISCCCSTRTALAVARSVRARSVGSSGLSGQHHRGLRAWVCSLGLQLRSAACRVRSASLGGGARVAPFSTTTPLPPQPRRWLLDGGWARRSVTTDRSRHSDRPGIGRRDPAAADTAAAEAGAEVGAQVTAQAGSLRRKRVPRQRGGGRRSEPHG